MAQLEKATDTKGNVIPSLYIDVESGCYYVRKSKSGKPHLFKSLGKVSISLAKRLKDQAIADWLGDDNPLARARLHRFSDIWEERYFPAKMKKVKPSTCTAYDVAYRSLLKPFFGDKFIEQINDKSWEAFLDETPREIILFNARKGLVNFLKYCQEHLEIIRSVPKLKLPPERKQRRIGARAAVGLVYEREQVVMAAMSAGAGSDLRLAILMGYRMGMRIGEICSLRFSLGQIDGQYNYCEFRRDGVVIHLNETKTKRDRHFYADPMVARILKHRRRKRASDWVFPQRTNPKRRTSTNAIDNYWQSLKRDLEITGRFHDLRHTFLTWKFREHGAKSNVALICNYAGLSLDEAERTYLHLNEHDTRSIVGRGHA